MPLIFGILVILNAVFLAWQFFEQQNSGQAVLISEQLPGKKLLLLSEKKSAAEPPNGDSQGTDGSSPAVRQAADTVSCYRIGPVFDADLLVSLRGALERSGFEVRVESFTQGGGDYQVYIPPQPTTERAQALARELKVKGLNAQISKDPRFANSVDVALFSDREQAVNLEARLSEMGYQPEVRLNASRQEQWLRVQSAGSSTKMQIDRLLGGTPNLRREPASCEI